MKTPKFPKLAASVFITLLSLFAGSSIAQAKRDIEGQVFIVTKGGENVKLGLVPIWVIGESEMKGLAKQAVELADAAALKKKLVEENKKLQEIEDKAVKELTESGAQKVKAAASEERQAMAKKFEPFSTAAERGVKLIEKVDKQKRGLDFGEVFSRGMLGSEFATKILIGLMAEKESDVESDADGRFKVSVDNGPGWAIAYGQRTLGKIGQTDIQNSELYYWVVELPQKKSQLFLSSNNCDIAEAEGKLRLIASETKTSRGISNLGATIEELLSASGRVQKVYAEVRAECLERERLAVADGVKDRDELLLVPILRGSFEMGSDAPVHSVDVSTFFMGEKEVTYGEWKNVWAWAKAKGYDFAGDGRGISDKHPVMHVSWYDALKWCNAKSEKEGLSPCYKVNGSPYRAGDNYSVGCDWNANGYRLPTEAEWEKAARGGLVGKKYPNGDNLTRDEANFGGRGTREVKGCIANGYGLYDMAGNVWEWCWDWYQKGYSGESNDPKGPSAGKDRVVRGGSWTSPAEYCSVSYRHFNPPDISKDYCGFRLVRRSGL